MTTEENVADQFALRSQTGDEHDTSREDAAWAGAQGASRMDAFDYLLDLSMSMPAGETDRHALLEAHESLSALNLDCGEPTALWSVWASTRSRAVTTRVAA